MATPTSTARFDTDDSAMRLAVLIDADNAQAAVIEGLLAEVARFGVATVKRIYGDFTSPTSAGWKRVLQKFAIKPVQQFAYTTGKNATDSTLIIDAMDLLYTRKFDGFCLVTSDSDFTGLAMRIREEGLTVFGFGEKKTPDAFRNACHKFIFTEVLRVRDDKGPKAAEVPADSKVASKAGSQAASKPGARKRGGKQAVEKPVVAEKADNTLPVRFMLDALEQSGDENGWAYLGIFGTYLNKLQPDFDSRNFGFKKLSDLVKAHSELFVTEERSLPGSPQKQLFVRAR
jgi:hypothetical protein